MLIDCSSSERPRLVSRLARFLDRLRLCSCGMGRCWNVLLNEFVFSMAIPDISVCLPPLGLLACSPWVPESPRWRTSAALSCPHLQADADCFLVLTRDRVEDAWKIVRRLHGDPNNEEDTFARNEFYQMVQQVQVDSTAWAQTGNKVLFTKSSYRKRMWMGFFIQYSAQTTGAMVIYLCMVQLYQNLGETGGMPLILGAAYVTVGAMSNFVGALLLDKVGRKPLPGASATQNKSASGKADAIHSSGPKWMHDLPFPRHSHGSALRRKFQQGRQRNGRILRIRLHHFLRWRIRCRPICILQ